MRATSRPMSASSMRAGRRLCPAWSMPTATSPSLAARTGSSVVPSRRKNCSRSRSTTETSGVARACAGPATSGPRSPWIPGMDGGGPSPSACGNGGSRTRTGRGSGSQGTWIGHSGVLTGGLAIEADDGPALLKAASTQLGDGADFLKLYLDGPKKEEAPWSTDDVRAVVELAHGRGAKVTAHSGFLVGARVGIDAGVDSLEHGFELDSDAVAQMARQGTFLVSTLAIFRSWASFAQTTTLPRFVSDEGKERIGSRRERAIESVHLAYRAGVRIASGTDFGGGSLRANHLAWEVEALVEAGLKPWEALASATVRGGDLLGETTAGRIVDGGPADFFLLHGDPLSDPTALRRVWRVAWVRD